MKLNKIAGTLLIASLLISCGGGSTENGSSAKTESPAEEGAVSYTHLTLPTILRV